MVASAKLEKDSGDNLKMSNFEPTQPGVNLPQKAESVEILDKGPTTNIVMIYFFKYSSKTHRSLC